MAAMTSMMERVPILQGQPDLVSVDPRECSPPPTPPTPLPTRRTSLSCSCAQASSLCQTSQTVPLRPSFLEDLQAPRAAPVFVCATATGAAREQSHIRIYSHHRGMSSHVRVMSASTINHQLSCLQPSTLLSAVRARPARRRLPFPRVRLSLARGHSARRHGSPACGSALLLGYGQVLISECQDVLMRLVFEASSSRSPPTSLSTCAGTRTNLRLRLHFHAPRPLTSNVT